MTWFEKVIEEARGNDLFNLLAEEKPYIVTGDIVVARYEDTYTVEADPHGWLNTVTPMEDELDCLGRTIKEYDALRREGYTPLAAYIAVTSDSKVRPDFGSGWLSTYGMTYEQKAFLQRLNIDPFAPIKAELRWEDFLEALSVLEGLPNLRALDWKGEGEALRWHPNTPMRCSFTGRQTTLSYLISEGVPGGFLVNYSFHLQKVDGSLLLGPTWLPEGQFPYRDTKLPPCFQLPLSPVYCRNFDGEWREVDYLPSREEVESWPSCAPVSQKVGERAFRVGIQGGEDGTPCMYLWEVTPYTYQQFRAFISPLPPYEGSLEADEALHQYFFPRRHCPRRGSFTFYPYEGEDQKYKIYY